MIRLTKLPVPKKLADNSRQWTNEYLTYFNDGVNVGKALPQTLARAYNHLTIKQALINETQGKCAYCESKMLATDPGDIEHILPKSARPDLCFEWSNLTFACTKCNREGKKDYHNDDLPLLNPYIDNPEEYLEAQEAFVFPIGKSGRGDITVNTIGLNRAGLLERRKDYLDGLRGLVKVWSMSPPGAPIKCIAEAQLQKRYASNNEYSFVIKAFLKSKGFPVK